MTNGSADRRAPRLLGKWLKLAGWRSPAPTQPWHRSIHSRFTAPHAAMQVTGNRRSGGLSGAGAARGYGVGTGIVQVVREQLPDGDFPVIAL
jgi:hypothetical protein